MTQDNHQAVAGEIARELAEIAGLVQRTTLIWETATHTEIEYYLDAVALNMQSSYAALERLLEMIAQDVDQDTPSGEAWHGELLDQMTRKQPGVRPPVLTMETRSKLGPYQHLRHDMADAEQLTPEQIEGLAPNLQPVMNTAIEEIELFVEWLETQ